MDTINNYYGDIEEGKIQIHTQITNSQDTSCPSRSKHCEQLRVSMCSVGCNLSKKPNQIIHS